MYNNFSEIYDELFPVSPEQKVFFIELAKQIDSPKNLLEVGCGTGELAISLDKHYNYIAAIDLDASMIHHATKKQHSAHLDFRQMDMKQISSVYFDRSFSVISCLGNTLAHLKSDLELQLFINSCRQLLRKKGKLVLQIMNYDKIYRENITSLAQIETKNYIFERKYDLISENAVIFNTIITSKKNNQQKTSETYLYPIRSEELLSILNNNIFSGIITYENFKKDPFKSTSDVLIIEAHS